MVPAQYRQQSCHSHRSLLRLNLQFGHLQAKHMGKPLQYMSTSRLTFHSSSEPCSKSWKCQIPSGRWQEKSHKIKETNIVFLKLSVEIFETLTFFFFLNCFNFLICIKQSLCMYFIVCKFTFIEKFWITELAETCYCIKINFPSQFNSG